MSTQAFESETIAPYIAFRRRGESDWVVIDPHTQRGRRLAAAYGFTPNPQKERLTMSAIPVTAPAHLRVVETNKAGYSALLAAKAKARAAYDFVVSIPKSAWAWARETFHLGAVETKVTGFFGWLKAKVVSVARMLGRTGLIGAGMLTVSTADGRRLLGMLAKPFVWAGKAITSVWSKIEDLLFVEDPSNALDSARNFVSERMADLREFLFGSGTTANRYGFLGNLAVKALIKVGPYLALDSKTMLTTRGIGAALFGAKLFTLASLLPVAGWIVFAVQAFIVMSTFVGAGEPLLQVAEQVTGIKVTATKKEGTEAAKVAATVTDIPVKAAAPTAAPNRAAKRAQDRRPTPAGRR